MKAKKKLILMLISLVCMSLIISACSGNGGKQTNNDATPSSSQDNASASTEAPKDKKIKIGVAMPHNKDFFVYLLDGMEEYQKTFSPDELEVTYVDAQNDPSKQISQIETFISQKMDAIVCLPVDINTGPEIVKRAKQANIPLVIVNREFPGLEEADAFVGSNSYESGTIQTEEVVKQLGGKGNIAIMNGVLGEQAAIDRTAATKDVIAKHPDMKIVLEKTASWDRAEGMKLMENWLNSGIKIDAVIANNDEMAIGAIMAAEAAGKLNDILFAGIDATPIALEHVKAGKLKVTVFQDGAGQGKGGLESAVKLARGEQVEKSIMIPYQLVTKDNVDEFIKKYQK